MEPCEWPVSYVGCTDDGTPPEPLGSMSASGRQSFEEMAGEYLWNWTGQVLGVCEVVVNPCRQDCTQGRSTFNGSGPFSGNVGAMWTPVVINGLWYNVGCGTCGDTCRCGGGSPLRLPGPIDSVVQVKEGDDVLSPDLYYVEGYNLLFRLDGKAWSPCDLEVTYRKGTPVPVGGQVAAGRLAVQLAKAACGDKTCELPQRVQTVTRQGVTVAMLDSFDDIDKGHTGIWLIDSWVSSMTKPATQSRVLSPDVPRTRFRR